MTISKDYSRMVYDDAMNMLNNSTHPCRHFLRWQQEKGYIPFQLPEPFSGKECKLGIVFLGLNPSVALNEIIPCATKETSFEQYDTYFRDRFEQKNRDQKGKLLIHYKDGSIGKPRLWNNLELFCNQHLNSACGPRGFRLGREALLSQAIRYKSSEGWLGDTVQEQQRVIAHQKVFMQRLLDEDCISIVVPMGNEALAMLLNLLQFSEKVPTTISEAMGNLYHGKTASGKTLSVCPIKHLSRPPSVEDKKKVATQILKALGR